jgi:hypothetical protein
VIGEWSKTRIEDLIKPVFKKPNFSGKNSPYTWCGILRNKNQDAQVRQTRFMLAAGIRCVRDLRMTRVLQMVGQTLRIVWKQELTQLFGMASC